MITRAEVTKLWERVMSDDWDYEKDGSRITAVREVMDLKHLHRRLDELCEVDLATFGTGSNPK